MAKRLKAMGNPKYQTDGNPATSGPGFGVATHNDVLTLPLRWRKPARIFVNSMSDLFHDKVPDWFIAEVFAVMACAPQHIYQVLTKRHGRMRSLLNSDEFKLQVNTAYSCLPSDIPAVRGYTWPLSNVWGGVSVEDQHWAGIRIPALVETSLAVRWVSAEPLLGPVEMAAHWLRPTFPGPRINWVVVGGESGTGARLMHPDWAWSLVKQCRAAGTAVFVKQLGSQWGRNHHDIGAFPEHLRVREYPAVTS
jgi:protein gp37